jgi:TolB-like protein
LKHFQTTTLSFLFISILSSQDTRPTVAVIDFDASGISQLEATSLTNRFRTSVGDVGVMRLVERGMMEEVLQEQGFQQTGCTSEECAVEVGQLLGVQNMIGGSIGRVGDTFTIDVRMISVQSGVSLMTKQMTYAGKVDGLIIEIEILAYELFEATIPDELLARRKSGVPVASVAVRQKTRMGAVMRSMIVPGLGQFYSGNKLYGTGFLVGELAVVGIFAATFSNYQTATDDYNNYNQLYLNEENQDLIAEYRSKIEKSHEEIEASKSLMDNLASAASSIWALNVVHAFLIKPDNSTASMEHPIRFTYDPKTRSTNIRFTIALD